MVHMLVVDEIVGVVGNSWSVLNLLMNIVARPFLFFLIFGTWLFWPHFGRHVLDRSDFFLDEHRGSLLVVTSGVLWGMHATGVALLILGCCS